MIHDKRSQFADATALSTAATGIANVGDVYDSGAVAKDLGAGRPVTYLEILVTTAVTSGGAATVAFQLVSDAQAAIAVDGSATSHVVSEAIPKATLVAGYRRAWALPRGNYEKFLGVQQNVGVAALTAGAIDAFLTETPGVPYAPPTAETGGL